MVDLLMSEETPLKTSVSVSVSVSVDQQKQQKQQQKQQQYHQHHQERRRRPAATDEYGFSPTLLPAVPCKFPSPLPRHYRILAWTAALFSSLSFYIAPTVLLLSPIVTLFFPLSSPLSKRLKTVSILVVINIILIKYPPTHSITSTRTCSHNKKGDTNSNSKSTKWLEFVRFYQTWYSIFHLRHNISPKTREIFENMNMKIVKGENEKGFNSSTSTSTSTRTTFIVTMHPHGIMNIHALMYAAFIDQYLPSLYGVGVGSDAAFSKPFLRQIISWIGVRSASRDSILECIQVEEEDIFIFPGGVQGELVSW